MATILPTDIVSIASTTIALTQTVLGCVVKEALAATMGKPKMKTRMNDANPAAFGPAAVKAVTSVRAPSKTHRDQTPTKEPPQAAQHTSLSARKPADQP